MAADAQARQQTFEWIGKRLRWAREQFPLTQTEFARSLDVSTVTLSKAESGQRALSVLTLITAANRLRCGTEYLLTGDLVAVEPELRERLVEAHPELLRPWGRVPLRYGNPSAEQAEREEREREEVKIALEVLARAASVHLSRPRRRAGEVPAKSRSPAPGGTDTGVPALASDTLPGGGRIMQPRTVLAG